jgi:hypothetical protein
LDKSHQIFNKTQIHTILHKINLIVKYLLYIMTRPFRNDYKSNKIGRKNIFEMKMFLAKCKKSHPWTMKQLLIVLGDLKKISTEIMKAILTKYSRKMLLAKI